MPTAYIAQDDPSIAEAVESLARGMSSPSEADLQQLERIGKYVVEYPTTAIEFVAQNMLEQVTVYVDTNHAGCAFTRSSTTGLATVLATQCVRHATTVQTTIALSGGESARPWGAPGGVAGQQRGKRHDIQAGPGACTTHPGAVLVGAEARARRTSSISCTEKEQSCRSLHKGRERSTRSFSRTWGFSMLQRRGNTKRCLGVERSMANSAAAHGESNSHRWLAYDEDRGSRSTTRMS